MPPRRSPRLLSHWLASQCRVSSEVLEMIVKVYVRGCLADTEGGGSVIPVMQACKFTRDVGLKLLYKDITLKETNIVPFLTKPVVSSYFLIDNIHFEIDRVTAAVERRLATLAERLRLKIGKAMVGKEHPNWSNDVVYGGDGTIGWIEWVSFYANEGCLCVVPKLCRIFDPFSLNTSIFDLVYPTEPIDTIPVQSVVFRALGEQYDINLELETGLVAEREDLPSPAWIHELFKYTRDFGYTMLQWPRDHKEEFMVAKAEHGLKEAMHLAGIEGVNEVLVECFDQHFFCAGGEESAYSKIKLDVCEEGECPMPGRKSTHPHAKAIEKIFRGEKVEKQVVPASEPAT